MSQAEGLDPGCRLSPVRIGVRAGWIFVSFDDDVMPLDDHVAAYEANFGFLRQDQCRLAHKLQLDFACNWGARDGMIPYAHGEAYAAEIAGARLVSIPDCGHALHLKRPKPLAEHIIEFAAR